jgi:hypothetical protein
LYANGIPMKTNSFNILDADNAWGPAAMFLYSHSLRAYRDPASFSTLNFKLSLRLLFLSEIIKIN